MNPSRHDGRRRTAGGGSAVAVVAAALLLTPAARTACAQAVPGAAPAATVGLSASVAGLWDDETHLGRGPAVAVEISRPLGGYLRVGIESGWFGHTRDAGYLAAEGDVLHVMGRASLLAGPRRWRTRPFLGTGLGIARSSGTLTPRDPFFAPHERAQSWNLTRMAWELHAGVRAAIGDRWVVRPEVRAGVIGRGSAADGLETPLVRLQGGVAVEWAPR